MNELDQVRHLMLPILENFDAELYDAEFSSGVLKIVVDRSDGIDVDTIGEISKAVSEALDNRDEFDGISLRSNYLLEVTSPGIERKLRTRDHFEKQLGNLISVKTKQPIEDLGNKTVGRRFQGTLMSVDDQKIQVDTTGVVTEFTFDQIESAHSVFDWNAETSKSEKQQSKSSTNKKVNSG